MLVKYVNTVFKKQIGLWLSSSNKISKNVKYHVYKNPLQQLGCWPTAQVWSAMLFPRTGHKSPSASWEGKLWLCCTVLYFPILKRSFTLYCQPDCALTNVCGAAERAACASITALTCPTLPSCTLSLNTATYQRKIVKHWTEHSDKIYLFTKLKNVNCFKCLRVERFAFSVPRRLRVLYSAEKMALRHQQSEKIKADMGSEKRPEYNEPDRRTPPWKEVESPRVAIQKEKKKARERILQILTLFNLKQRWRGRKNWWKGGRGTNRRR